MHKDHLILDPSWRLLPTPPDANSTGVFNEDIIDLFENGRVRPVHGLKRFEAQGVELSDGERVEVDVVILATGYRFSYDILDPNVDPTRSSPEWDSSPNVNNLPYPRLYQTLFHPDHPSLAFIGPCMGYTFASFKHADLASQAVAQIWAGYFELPNQREMHSWCDANYHANLRLLQYHRIPKPTVDGASLENWLNKAAGNGLDESLGWGLRGWCFYLRHFRLYRMIVGGINTPFVGRLFPDRQGNYWAGAKAAIQHANS